VIPVFARRLGYFDYEVEVSSALRLERTSSADDLRRAAADASRALEAFVARYPTQWFRFSPAPPVSVQMP
jgi:lauroyl/myristoyl acyltransferase